MGDLENRQTYTLLRAARYLKDTRIPPPRFDKEQVPDGIAVVGEAATDPDFIGGSDLVTYRMRLGDVSGGVSVFVELKYQTLPFGYLRDLRQDAKTPRLPGSSPCMTHRQSAPRPSLPPPPTWRLPA